MVDVGDALCGCIIGDLFGRPEPADPPTIYLYKSDSPVFDQVFGHVAVVRGLAARKTNAASAGAPREVSVAGKRVAGEGVAASTEQVQSIYSILYSRQPSAAELDLALGFLQLPTESRLTRWEQYSHALLAANEMSFID